MIRRSKIKVRPAIRKSTSATNSSNKPVVESKPTLKSTTQEVQHPVREELQVTPNKKENSPNLTLNSSTTSPQLKEISSISNQEIKSSSNETTEPYNDDSAKPEEVPCPVKDKCHENNSQKTRRRKLVACPLTARKRPKVNVVQDAQLKVCAEQPTNNEQINEKISSPHKPIHHTPCNDINPLTQESSETAILTVPAGEVSEFDDSLPCKEYAILNTVTVTSDEEITTTTHTLSKETDTFATPSVNIEIVSEPSTDTEKQQDTLFVAPYVKKKVEKKKSKIAIQRDAALEKLKKLKDNQSGDEKGVWPDIDQNIISMSDLIYLNPPMSIGLTLGMNATKETSIETVIAQSPKTCDKTDNSNTSKQVESSTEESLQEQAEPSVLPVPQIRIAEDGTVIVDEDSLIMDNKKPDNPTISTVYEFGRESTVNQCSFLRKRPKPNRWSASETDKFYRCLCIVGAEFSLMAKMFRQKSADDLRRKYRRERKNNPMKVDNALKHQHLSKWTDEMFEPQPNHTEMPIQQKS